MATGTGGVGVAAAWGADSSFPQAVRSEQASDAARRSEKRTFIFFPILKKSKKRMSGRFRP
jgi:hypothetical protein